ncbi:MAG: SMC family ATPase [Treponema sp.]|nr:SMC family ATPase [Treponema sp.]
MRPIKIIISGFCSYLERTEIDFTKFGQQGLYLITGNTGAGKTTIFDAITYALYGEASGPNRSVSMLRSDFAGPEDPTQVELTFELRDKIYHIKRNPSYQRKAKKGEGLVNEAADAELTLPDGRIISGQSQVDKEVEALLGLSKNQFSQIVMLAQGDFQKLLTADTKDRQLIFRRIFKTENFESLQKRLAEAKKELDSKVGDSSRSLNQYFDSVSSDEKSPLLQELEEAKGSSAIKWEEKLILIEKLIDEDKKQQSELAEESEKNKKELDKVNIELAELDQIKKAREELAQTKKDLSEAENKLLDYEAVLADAKKKDEDSSKLDEEKVLLNQDLEKYSQLEKLSKELADFESEKENAQTEVSRLEKEIEGKSSEIEEIKQEITNINQKKDKRPELIKVKTETEGKISKTKDLQTAYNEYLGTSRELDKAQKEYIEASQHYEGLNQEYNEKNKAYLDGQAGILAQNLEENKPCPVCGSLHHPSPAQKTASIPSEEELQSLKKAVDQALNKSNDKSKEAGAFKGQLESQTKNVEKLLKELLDISTIEELEKSDQKIIELLSNLNSGLLATEKEIENEDARFERKSTLEAKLPVMNEEVEALRKKQTSKNNIIIQEESNIDNAKKNLQDISRGLKYQTKAQALEKINNLDKEIKGIKAFLESAQENFNNCKTKIASLQAKKEENEKATKSDKLYDEEALQAKGQFLQNQAQQYEDTGKKIFSRLSTNQNAYENIKSKSSDLSKLEEKLTYVTELNSTANGNLGQGKTKLMLETYVQMHYFDRIIAHANKRFEKLSNGQYTLVRKVEADDKRSQSGLELNVINHNNGSQRDVKSLSGGESFEASLSLALGLSDEITQNAGGIKMDTMFVDEGFGTLDDDTLDKAYKALCGITEGKRLIGIISHVGYLKDKIDQKIIVEKEAGKPSHVTIKV